jgi:phosphoheptose isomerase
MHAILRSLTTKYTELNECLSDIIKAFEVCKLAVRNNGKLLLCGNGGSASDSEHMVGELMKGFVRKRPVPSEDRGKLVRHYPGDGHDLADRLQRSLRSR